MDPATTERLQKLQMADLGTARREYISTADNAKFNKIRLEDIEATRLSNKVGSLAQRKAEENKDKLAEWANVHKTIGDTEDLEDLDNLLNGQSHRANLSASIRRVEEPIKSSRGARSSGRGGGVAGTRGRQVAPYPPLTAANSVPIPPDKNRLKDLALVPEVKKKDHEISSQGSKNSSSRQSSFSYGKKPPGFLKSRRPITGDFSALITPPESFMAAARQRMQIQETATEASAPIAPSSTTVREPVQAQKAAAETPTSKTLPPKVTKHEPMQNREVMDGDKPRSSMVTDTTCKSQDAAKQGSQTSSVGNTSIKTQNGREGPPKAKDVKLESSGSEAVSLGHPKDQEQRVYQSKHEQNQPVTPSKKALAPRQTNPNSKASIETDILLDFSASPPRECSLHGDTDVLASPALQDLKGLQFQDNLFDRGTLSPGNAELSNSLFAPSKSLGFQDTENEEATATDTQGSTPVVHPSPHDDPQYTIDLLCELMESTSLSDEHREHLKVCKKEIEAKIHGSQGSTPTKRKTTTLKVPQTALPEIKRETPEELLGPGSFSLAQTPVAGLTRPKLVLTNSPSPQSQWNIKAPPFVPRDVSNYRSPPNGFSSESTGSQKSTTQPTSVDSDHIIGDHLLPGRKGSHGALGLVPRNGSTSTVLEKPSFKFDMPKVPRSTPILQSNPFSPKPTESLKAPIERPKKPIEVSIPQVLPRLAEPTTPLRVQKSRAVRITDPNGNDLSESIYAPKPAESTPTRRAPSSGAPTAAVKITNPNSSPRSRQSSAQKPAETQPKATARPATTGLESSIYATSTSCRPLR